MGKYLDASPFGRGRAMRQTPSDMRRIGQPGPSEIKGGECKCVVYACVLYRCGKTDTRGFGMRLQIAREESRNRNRLWLWLDGRLDTRNRPTGSAFLPHKNVGYCPISALLGIILVDQFQCLARPSWHSIDNYRNHIQMKIRTSL